MSVQDKVVLITGASRGIGLATAQAFAQRGAKVVLAARDVSALEMAEDTLLAAGSDVLGVPTDISDPQAVLALREEINSFYGGVDIVVNNAAIAIKQSLLESTPQDWQAMLDVNVLGLCHVTQTFLAQMVERRAGTIINLSAAIAKNGFPNLAVYSATKAAVIAFSEGLAKEVRRYGVNVYVVCPHGVATGLYHSIFGQAGADNLLMPEYVAQEILALANGERALKSGETLELTAQKASNV